MSFFRSILNQLFIIFIFCVFPFQLSSETYECIPNPDHFPREETVQYTRIKKCSQFMNPRSVFSNLISPGQEKCNKFLSLGVEYDIMIDTDSDLVIFKSYEFDHEEYFSIKLEPGASLYTVFLDKKSLEFALAFIDRKQIKKAKLGTYLYGKCIVYK